MSLFACGVADDPPPPLPFPLALVDRLPTMTCLFFLLAVAALSAMVVPLSALIAVCKKRRGVLCQEIAGCQSIKKCWDSLDVALKPHS